VLLLLLPAVLLSLPILAQAQGMLLVAVLKGTGMYELGYGVLLAVGLVLGSS
jgi:1,4-dihydroxy-2-naphthoate octaprenyltransferase